MSDIDFSWYYLIINVTRRYSKKYLKFLQISWERKKSKNEKRQIVFKIKSLLCTFLSMESTDMNASSTIFYNVSNVPHVWKCCLSCLSYSIIINYTVLFFKRWCDMTFTVVSTVRYYVHCCSSFLHLNLE